MTVRSAAPSHDKLARMALDIRQLTEPIYAAVRGRIVTHGPLLDQLRDACIPSSSTLTETIRRRSRESRPPASTAAISTLSEIEVGIAYWRVKLELPSPVRSLDWFKATLGMFPAAAQDLAPSIGDWLATEVNGWWHDAAVGSGWRPQDLLRLR